VSPRVLAYVGTYNEPVETALRALSVQTRPPDAIVVVDNASTQDAPSAPPPGVTLLRNAENLGPSGAISTGMRFAFENGFDWVWIFDADSTPEPDALEKLLGLYEGLDAGAQAEVGALCCAHRLHPSERLFHGRRLTPGGPRKPRIDPSREWHECDAVLWSGSLYRIDAVRKIGLPRCGTAGYWDDFGHDYGDMEFSHRLRQAGYRLFVHRASVLHHRVGASRTVPMFGRRSLTTNHPAERRFLFFRNMVYFWVHVFRGKNWPALACWFAFRFTATVAQIVLSEPDKRARVAACARGVWCGLRGNLATRG
jgi:rhamnosyltransferase